MGKEVLAVPEAYLGEVIRVIRAGLKATKKNRKVGRETREQLEKWCKEEREYLDRLVGEGELGKGRS